MDPLWGNGWWLPFDKLRVSGFRNWGTQASLCPHELERKGPARRKIGRGLFTCAPKHGGQSTSDVDPALPCS